jgi:hypothetical protein
MGRWGDELYESDSARDYFLIAVTKKIERELAFWLSPEEVDHDSWWLSEVLTVVELILLLKRNESGGDVFIDNPRAVQRWREVFFSVWDGEWHPKSRNFKAYAYDAPDYRKQHRAAVMERFDDLERIAHYWVPLPSPRLEHPPLPRDYPLPYYSLYHWTDKNNEEVIMVERFIRDLIRDFIHEIGYLFSSEERENVWWTDIEDVWVAVDQLSLLGEAYQQGTVNEQKVRRWREINIEVWKQEMGELPSEDKPDTLYNNILHLFDRLEVVAKKYPAYE